MVTILGNSIIPSFKFEEIFIFEAVIRPPFPSLILILPSASIIFFEGSKETLSASSLYPSLIIKTEPVARIFPLSLIYSILSASRIF